MDQVLGKASRQYGNSASAIKRPALTIAGHHHLAASGGWFR